MTKLDLANGMTLVEMPEADLSVLCGCPENAVKFLIKRGVIREIERAGVRFETGPNAILLSELPVQAGRFRNLGEFPVLQMLYRQGMIIPGHPGNTGLRPMIIGMRDQVEAQSRYIYSGNYGLGSVDELMAAGLSRADAEEQFRMKLKFAFGSIRRTEELLDLRVFDGHAIELRGGAFVSRIGLNRYEFLCAGESVRVDLDPGERHELPYELSRLGEARRLGEAGRAVSRDAFSVVHLGEGDGWDTERPCMSSLVVFRGDYYLVDAGPDIEASLASLGVGINELRGIFHTHAHDDHFVGLTALLRAERRLGYFAAPWVRASVEAKLRALTGIGESEFRRYFDVRDLDAGRWNDVNGLEVFPTMSPHPVETTILRFRARDGEGYRSYAHLADVASFAVLDSMVTADPSLPGISAELAERTKAAYLEPADVKKIDAGGGMIHGAAADFSGDTSGRVLLSHNAADLGSGGSSEVARFGEIDALIPGAFERIRAADSAAPPGLSGLEALVALLRGSPVFASLSGESLNRIAASAIRCARPEGRRLCGEDGPPALLLVASGSARVVSGDRTIGYLRPGDCFGEEGILVEGRCLFEGWAAESVEGYLVPAAELESRPILLWRLREALEGRLAAVKCDFDFSWRRAYSVGEDALDRQHERLFALIGALDAAMKRPESCPDSAGLFEELADFAALHFASEASYMRAGGCPEIAAHAREHEALLRDFWAFRERLDCGDAGVLEDFDGFLKDWAIKHTLLIDRQYMPFLPSALASGGSSR